MLPPSACYSRQAAPQVTRRRVASPLCCWSFTLLTTTSVQAGLTDVCCVLEARVGPPPLAIDSVLNDWYALASTSCESGRPSSPSFVSSCSALLTRTISSSSVGGGTSIDSIYLFCSFCGADTNSFRQEAVLSSSAPLSREAMSFETNNYYRDPRSYSNYWPVLCKPGTIPLEIPITTCIPCPRARKRCLSATTTRLRRSSNEHLVPRPGNEAEVVRCYLFGVIDTTVRSCCPLPLGPQRVFPPGMQASSFSPSLQLSRPSIGCIGSRVFDALPTCPTTTHRLLVVAAAACGVPSIVRDPEHRSGRFRTPAFLPSVIARPSPSQLASLLAQHYYYNCLLFGGAAPDPDLGWHLLQS